MLQFAAKFSVFRLGSIYKDPGAKRCKMEGTDGKEESPVELKSTHFLYS
jgi:hypothetical protein